MHGFALDEDLGSVRVPMFQGADTSRAYESTRVDMTNAAVLEFSNNEAYGGIQTGLDWVWNGTVSNFTVWHASQGIKGTPPEQLVLDELTVRGDRAVLDDPSEAPVGIWIANYLSRQVSVTNADVQAMRVGIMSPFFYDQTPDPRRGTGSLVVENGYFFNHVGVSIATAYAASDGDMPVKQAIVRSSVFERLDPPPGAGWPAETISMNWGMTPRDAQPRAPIAVYDYNRQPGNDFKVYYSYDAPPETAPCQDTVPEIGGWVCE